MIETLLLAAFVLIIVALVVWFIILFNRFQVLRNGAEAGLSQIAVALKKRLDMISQLIEIVKSYAKFERGVFEKITELRSRINQAENAENIRHVDEQSKGILDKILAVVENYPTLKASENVAALMKTVTDVEDEIARQRYTYNNIVQEFNTRRTTVPSNVVARLCSFKKLDYLKFEDEVNTAPKGTWNQ